VRALDLFAGHGWGIACRRLGIDEFAVEISDSAVATRAANGMQTLYRDVWEGLEDPNIVPEHELLIASPPCPTFSPAGKGEGRRAMPELLQAIDDRRYESVESLRALAEETDPASALVLVPLAYAWRNRPTYIVLEQVREVLPIWLQYVEVLRSWGYSAWAGILNSEQYGVPQTRRRAILIARRDGRPAAAPRPTHSRYYERDPARVDPGVERWVSMERAFGWNGQPLEIVSNYGTRGNAEARGVRRFDEPAATITSKAGRNVLRVTTGQNSAQANGETKRYTRDTDRPSPTVTGQARSWRLAGAGRTAERTGGQRPRPLDTPAHTMTGGGTAVWLGGDESINLTPEEAAILQSYPADFVLDVEVPDRKRGGTKPITKGDKFQGIGNAVPPLLAAAVLGSLLDDAEPLDSWADAFAGVA
jgi:DNA (cytosine-5)-methyltransferase 1